MAEQFHLDDKVLKEIPRGYIEDTRFNLDWQRQGLVCPYEHCIETMPTGEEESMEAVKLGMIVDIRKSPEFRTMEKGRMKKIIKKIPKTRPELYGEIRKILDKAKASVVTTNLDPEENARCIITTEVAGGFSSDEEIIELVENVCPELTHGQIEQMTKKAMAEHKADEEQWKELTDCDKLDMAFITMEQDGILARQHFTDCQSCGNNKIGDEIQKAQAAGTKIRGYTFYHSQDTEIAVMGNGLCLAFGVLFDNVDEAKKLGYEITEHLRHAGLETEWNGDVKSRIFIPMIWKKRRYTKAPTL
jgi:hypothetical protein